MNRDRASDVVIIGSGLGGSTLAYRLVSLGLEVTLVEQGEFLSRPGASLAPVYKDRFTGPIVGGPSKFYGAAMYRLREADFEAGETGNGPAPAWPISYEDLEPHYCEAERLYHVHGSSENDPSEPRRSRPWPHPPIPHQGPAADLVSRLIQKGGVPVSHIPRALDYDPSAGGACVLCQHCDAYYCPRDAKMDAEIAALRPALGSGRLTLLTNTKCLQILVTADGQKAQGVRVETMGEQYRIHAPVVAISAGVFESPLLLWRSRTRAHPNGLANSSGALGRNLAAHSHAWLFPVVPGVQKAGFHQKTFAINAFYHSAPDWPYPCGTIQAAGHMEAWSSYPQPGRALTAALLRNSFQVFAMAEALPSANSGFELSDDGPRNLSWPKPNKKALSTLQRLAREIFSAAGYYTLSPPSRSTDWHPVGTAGMGDDPRTSVIDSFCRTHDVDGLYVVDASSLPRAGAVNTGLTIVALALRAADRIQNEFTPREGVRSSRRFSASFRTWQ